jgi:HD superfamily phosphohydrolase
MAPPLSPEHIVKLAIGAKHATDLSFSKWERILSEIIVGDSFGVDRIDYLLRDSYHAGVAYGRFDHYRLIDELRILPSFKESTEPTLGINEGGIYSAESMALARYFMFSQVYYHPIRLIYDRHLQDFLTEWLAQGKLFGGTFSTDVEGHLRMTDNEVNSAMRIAAFDSSKAGHDAARRIMAHQHFKVLYERNPQDIKINSDPGAAIEAAAVEEFGNDAIRASKPKFKGIGVEFPVRTRDTRVEQAIAVSETLSTLRPTPIDYVYVNPDLERKASEWLDKNREEILSKAGKAEDENE